MLHEMNHELDDIWLKGLSSTFEFMILISLILILRRYLLTLNRSIDHVVLNSPLVPLENSNPQPPLIFSTVINIRSEISDSENKLKSSVTL